MGCAYDRVGNWERTDTIGQTGKIIKSRTSLVLLRANAGDYVGAFWIPWLETLSFHKPEQSSSVAWEGWVLFPVYPCACLANGAVKQAIVHA